MPRHVSNTRQTRRHTSVPHACHTFGTDAKKKKLTNAKMTWLYMQIELPGSATALPRFMREVYGARDAIRHPSVMIGIMALMKIDDELLVVVLLKYGGMQTKMTGFVKYMATHRCDVRIIPEADALMWTQEIREEGASHCMWKTIDMWRNAVVCPFEWPAMEELEPLMEELF